MLSIIMPTITTAAINIYNCVSLMTFKNKTEIHIQNSLTNKASAVSLVYHKKQLKFELMSLKLNSLRLM